MNACCNAHEGTLDNMPFVIAVDYFSSQADSELNHTKSDPFMPFKFSLFRLRYYFATFYAAITLGKQLGDQIYEGSRLTQAAICMVIIASMFMLSRSFFKILQQHYSNDKNLL